MLKRYLTADHTDEKMIPLFDRDTDGSLMKRKVGPLSMVFSFEIHVPSGRFKHVRSRPFQGFTDIP